MCGGGIQDYTYCRNQVITQPMGTGMVTSAGAEMGKLLHHEHDMDGWMDF